jgi:hypothetical protein
MFPSQTKELAQGESASNDNGSLGKPKNRRDELWLLAYERKFSDFLFILRSTKESLIAVPRPEVLGDTYHELVESLERIATAGKRLAIVPRHERG